MCFRVFPIEFSCMETLEETVQEYRLQHTQVAENERSALEQGYLSKSIETTRKWPKEKKQPWTSHIAHATLERKELCVRAALVNVPSSD